MKLFELVFQVLDDHRFDKDIVVFEVYDELDRIRIEELFQLELTQKRDIASWIDLYQDESLENSVATR